MGGVYPNAPLNSMGVVYSCRSRARLVIKFAVGCLFRARARARARARCLLFI